MASPAAPFTAIPARKEASKIDATGICLGCVVLDATGTEVSRADVQPQADIVLLRELAACRGRLTAYYFLRGGRQVTLLVHGVALKGRLSTRWCKNRRQWQLEVGATRCERHDFRAIIAGDGNAIRRHVMAKDPVCGMDVNEQDAAATSEYQGKTYYFCSPGCKTRFDREPGKYVAA